MNRSRLLSIAGALVVLLLPLLIHSACAPNAPLNNPEEEVEWGKKTRPDQKQDFGSGQILVGVSSRILDGPVGTSMAGYGGRGGGRRSHWSDQLKGTAGFYGMQSAKAVAIEVGKERMAFLKIPLMSSESYVTDAIVRHLRQSHGLDFEGRIITMAGHSHHTTARYWPIPDLLGNVGVDSFDAEVAEMTAAVFADAIAEAWENREQGEWAYGWVEDWDPDNEVYRNRRSQNQHGKDPRLSMIAFRKKSDQTPLAAIMNFPIHGTVLDTKNDLFSEDAPGYVEHKFEELFYATKGQPIFGMLAQSSGGDTSPGGDRLGHPPLARLERIGEAAAPKILALYDSLEWKDHSELAIRTQRLELIHERIYKGKPWEEEFRDVTGQDYTHGAWMCSPREGSMEGQPKYCVDLGYFLELVESEVPHNASHQALITTARLGDVWMLTVPGEPLWSLVRYLREEAAQRLWNNNPMELMVIGYAQDHLLYLASPDDWYLGGYEVEMHLWGPGGGRFLVDEGLSMIDAMVEGYNGPTFYEDSPSLFDPPEFLPRNRELSIDAGKIVEEPEPEAARTQTLRFAANCGDPALGNPYLRVQRQENSGFVDIPGFHGWEGSKYDNSRYEMVSVYLPDPPVSRWKSEEKRQHLWQFYWQVPPDWPAGKYRFGLECKTLDNKGEEIQELSLHSKPFTVTMPKNAEVKAWSEDGRLFVRLETPGLFEETTEATRPQVGSWASSGYRLLDAHQCHHMPAVVRAALKVEVLDSSNAQKGSSLTLNYEPEARAHVIELDDATPENGSVRVWLAADQTPSILTGPILEERPEEEALPTNSGHCKPKEDEEDGEDGEGGEESEEADPADEE